MFAETVTITGLDPMKTHAGRSLYSRGQLFRTLEISCASSVIYSPNSFMAWSIHGHFSGFLENSVIEQSQLRAEILKGDVGVNQVISPHLRFMLIVRVDVVRRSNFLVNRGSQLEDTVCQQRCVSFRSLGADGESVKL